MKRTPYTYILLLLALFCGCTGIGQQVRWRIGVSQCSEDIWRDKLNSELLMGAYAHEGVELLFASADDSDERQVQQIDSFIAEGIDLLIVAPNQMATVSPAIDRAFDSGIPVIVYERKTSSHKFTAYMGGDNRLMGRQMGEYVAQLLGGHGHVVEIMGLKGSSPAIERHQGFSEALDQYPGIELIETLQGDWTQQSGYDAMLQYLDARAASGQTNSIDFVFGQNDRMALGARQALQERHNAVHPQSPVGTRFCGIDGLPGKDGGIVSVRDSLLAASYIYPTHGDEVLELAFDILEGNEFPTETALQGTLVTRQNARALLLQADEIDRQTRQIDHLHALAKNYNSRLIQQRTFTLLAVCAAVLLAIVLLLFYLYHRSQVNIRRERVLSNVWNLKTEENKPAEASTPEDASTPPSPAEAPQPSSATEEEEEEEKDASTPLSSRAGAESLTFIARFRETVEERLADSEVSVEDLASDMNLSRVQLYRKVKALTGSSPVELLRTARLNRGHQMLLTTDKTVAEVAYDVGFSAPAYFTKCFKEEFGFVPGDVRK